MEEEIVQTMQTEMVSNVDKWYTPLTRVTPLSKYLAMALFVALPFVGFWLGVGYATRVDNQPVGEFARQKAFSSVDEQSDTTAGDAPAREEGALDGALVQSPDPLSVHDLQVGDTIAGFTVKSVQIWPTVYADGSQDFQVEFSGTTTVRGVVQGPMYACELGFAVAEDPDPSLPVFREYTQVNNFCFTNADALLHALGEQYRVDGSEVAIVIQDFVFHYAHKGGGHTATFVGVESATVR